MSAPSRSSPDPIFETLLAKIAREEAADPRPDAPVGSPAFAAWQRRHWKRETVAIELREARELTTDARDPAPLASEGLTPFLSWAIRQDERRRRRR